MLIQTVLFQRKKDAQLEAGLLIGHMNTIIDRQYKLVKRVYNYKPKPNAFLIDLDSILTLIEDRTI